MRRLLLAPLVLLFTVVLVLPAPAHAQKTIRGTVSDAATGEALPEANIFVEGTRRGTITNRAGRYALRIDALPATVVFRYVGYQTRRLRIEEASPQAQDVRLEAATAALEDVTVTAEREDAADIMRRVIAAKQERRRRLKTFRADAYNRFVIRNDTGIVSVVESLTKFFWDKERGPREVVLSQRQTANLGLAQALPAGLFVTNLYDDEIDVAGYELIGVTHPDALGHYRFRLDSVRVLDGRGVYDISVEPKNRFESAFTGHVSVLDGAYALVAAELRPARSFLFPPPIRDLTIRYRQRFSDFGGDFWLPISLRSEVRAKIELPLLLSFPTFRIEQVSRLSDYEVNAPLPDSLYDEAEEEEALARSAFGEEAPGDSLLRAEAAATVPLEAEEARAVASIDSTQTLARAFEPSGPLAALLDLSATVNDEEVVNTGEEERGADSTAGGGPALPFGLGFAPRAWFNRVEGAHLGGRVTLGLGERFELAGVGGYQTARKAATYGATFSADVPGGLDFEAGYRYGTDTRYDSRVYDLFGGVGRLPNTLQTLYGADDYFDYYQNERLHASLSRALPLPVESRLTVGVRAERHRSVRKRTSYDLLGRDNEQPPNPPVPEGDLRSAYARLTLGEASPGARFGVTGQRRLVLEAEHSPGGLAGNDFDFTRFRATADYRVETFLRRRLLPMTLDVRLTGATFAGRLPLQRFSIVEARLGGIGLMGALKTLEDRPYEGEQQVALFWEHNFRTVPFEALGLYPLAERGWNLLLYGGHGRTWVGRERQDALAARGISLNTPGGFHHEIGVGLSGLLGLFRVNLTKRLDARGWAVGAGLARIF